MGRIGQVSPQGLGHFTDLQVNGVFNIIDLYYTLLRIVTCGSAQGTRIYIHTHIRIYVHSMGGMVVGERGCYLVHFGKQ